MPFHDRGQVAAALAATSEMRVLIARGFAIERTVDPSTALARARRASTLSGDELRTIGLTIAAADAAIRAVRADETPQLAQLVVHVRTLRELAQDLMTCIGSRGEVLDAASPQLARLRRNAVEAGDAARQRCTQLMRSAAIARALQDTTVTQRDNRYVLPVKAEFAAQVPGIVHDTSASGHTVFIEPLATIETNNRIRTARLEEQREVERILTSLTTSVSNEAQSIGHLLAVLTVLDVAYARARLAEAMDAHPLRLVAGVRMQLTAARHPLLDRRAVPQSFSLGPERRLIIISGPNMGGKTVALKCAGLALLMTACGLHFPADPSSEIGAFTHVRADIGDAQSIAMNASTFSAHLGHLREILAAANDGLLFLVDEIAGGTEPASGAALAIAVLDRLLACGASGIVTTHAQELKTYAQEREAVSNAGMRFTPDTHVPTFELDLGVPGRSLAFDLAAREGLDAALLADARARVDQREHNYDRALAELSEARARVAEALAAARDERLGLHHERESAAKERAALERERAAFTDQAEVKLAQILRRFAAELAERAPGGSRTKVTRSQSELMMRTLDEMRRDLRLEPQTQKPADERPLKVGMRVRVRGMGGEGTISEDLGNDVAILIGSMRMVMPKRDCVAVTTAPPKRRVQRAAAADDERTEEQALRRIGNVATELDVRGKRFLEAQELVDRWLDTALLAGYSPLRIIHGKGTGALGTGLQAALRTHPSIKHLRYGNENEGGSGVTILDI